MRPLDLPPAERFAHGTRSRYVTGCRCAACRESNRLYYHQRQALIRERAAELEARQRAVEAVLGEPEPALAPQEWTAPDGSKQIRLYARACPGLKGPCPWGSHLRRDSKGGVCRRCRGQLAFDGLVPADRARQHLLWLSKEGVGRNSVMAACDVPRSSLAAIRSGAKTRIRASVEKRILSVDVGAAADASTVKAGPTWANVRELLRLGLTKGEISRRIGNKTAALQLGRRRVLARNALAIEKLLREEKARRRTCPRCGESHRDDRLAADWCRANAGVPLDELELAAGGA